MEDFRRINNKLMPAWAVLLSLLILSAQGVTLHIHSVDHDPHQSHHSIDDLIDHEHPGQAHVSFDSSHQDHHDEVASEIEACPDCILKQVSANLLSIALVAIVLFLLTPGFYRTRLLYNRGKVSLPPQFHILPPLRAPPL
jgi:hypothetical protein